MEMNDWNYDGKIDYLDYEEEYQSNKRHSSGGGGGGWCGLSLIVSLFIAGGIINALDVDDTFAFLLLIIIVSFASTLIDEILKKF